MKVASEHQSFLDLPFHLAAKNSPSGCMLAEVCIMWSLEGEVETQCVITHESSKEIVWTSPKLSPTVGGTCIAWRGDETRLAVSQFTVVHISDRTTFNSKTSSGSEDFWILEFTKPISELIYAKDGVLYILAGSTLYRYEEPKENRRQILPHTIAATDVHAIAEYDGDIYLVRNALDDETELCVSQLNSSDEYKLTNDVENADHYSIRITPEGEFYIGLQSCPTYGKVQFKIFHLSSEELCVSLESEVDISISKIDWKPTGGNGILVLAKVDNIRSLWLVSGAGSMKRLSGCETNIDIARWSLYGDRVIISGDDIYKLGCKRSLYIDFEGNIFWERAVGTSDVIWHSKNEYTWIAEAESKKQRWVRHRENSDSFIAEAAATKSSVIKAKSPHSSLSSSYVFKLPKNRAQFGILYLTGHHRSFVLGAEKIFYHYAIRSMLEELCEDSGILIGKSRGFAENQESANAEIRVYKQEIADIHRGVQQLRKQCNGPVFILATSLGCLSLLSYLSENHVDGAILTNPVYSADIPMLRPWRYMFSEQNSLQTATDIYAPKFSSPLLIVHGQRDPITPLMHSSEFVMSLPESLRCDYVTVPNEGHVFQTDAGWGTLFNSVSKFLRDIVGM